MSKPRLYRSEGIVLRRQDFGEADRLLTLYTQDFGKIRVIAKGARKPHSRKAGHVELFMRSKMLFATGRNIDLLTQVELQEAYRPLREDLVRVTYASHVVELLDRFTAENDNHPELFQLLADALGWLVETRDLMLTARYYELRLLSLVGYEPRLFQCVGCGETLAPRDQFFSPEMGGVLCPECQRADARALPLSLAALKVLRYMQTRPYSTVRVLHVRRALHTELETITLQTIQHILERRLQSADFLKRLRHEAAADARERKADGKLAPESLEMD